MSIRSGNNWWPPYAIKATIRLCTLQVSGDLQCTKGNGRYHHTWRLSVLTALYWIFQRLVVCHQSSLPPHLEAPYRMDVTRKCLTMVGYLLSSGIFQVSSSKEACYLKKRPHRPLLQYRPRRSLLHETFQDLLNKKFLCVGLCCKWDLVLLEQTNFRNLLFVATTHLYPTP